ncbi:MAG: aldehyde dehydrogenase family protein [Tepidisphaeraceae bacterium]|jgi:aldehyde dehydrogenase (NAD+)
MSTREFLNCINGQFTPAVSGKTFEVRNPAHKSEVVAIMPDSAAADMAAAVAAAVAAFPAWSKLPPGRRAVYLEKAAEALARRRDEAATLLVREEGKHISEARGEVDRSVGLLDYYAAQSHLLTGQTVPSTMDNRLAYTLRSPLGPVGIITPWNFPSAIPIWKTAPALICGNTVVLKTSPRSPASAGLFAECLAEAGLPAGVFNLVHGGKKPGEALTSDARIKAISFTGSLAVGQSIMRKCADRLIRIGLEMGGKNPLIVMDDADLDRAVNDAVVGAFWAAGHKCTATSRVIVLESVHDAFVEKLLARTAQLKVGDGLDPAIQIPPVIDEAQLNVILNYISIGRAEGATLACGGGRLAGGIHDEGCYLSPAVFTHVTPGMRIAREEIFGPVLCVIKAKNLDEAIQIANDVPFGLAAGICTRSLAHAMEFSRRIDAGVIHVNNPTAGLELQLPFGGCKCSTSGYREMGTAAIDFYTQTRTFYIDP